MDLDKGGILEDPAEMIDFVRSDPDTARRTILDKTLLTDARLQIEKHIKNTYLKQAQAPVGVKPLLKAWMELN